MASERPLGSFIQAIAEKKKQPKNNKTQLSISVEIIFKLFLLTENVLLISFCVLE